ncbi:MAG: PQQ-binding-like beta-propeller repeat protein [Geminicoccaceae bacterium]|nr:PQQ-binding-like beta-propeller repeat protein [Geminicoccaceae bacterium]MCB9944857.1 PQQ-binding-like beta-propeller repeat protein [Geminicoccaceae bacterium]
MIRRRHAVLVGCLLPTLLVAGCSGWWGQAEDPPLPGKRQSVMLLDERIVADPRISGLNITLPEPRANATWEQAGGNATHAMEHLALKDGVQQVWRADIGAGTDSSVRLMSSPVVAMGRVFTVDAEGTLSAFDTTDGKLIWRVTPEGLEDSDRLPSGGLAYGNGQLFVGTGSGMAISFSAEDGRETWRRALLAPIRISPTVTPDLLLVTTSDNQLIAMDPLTGDVRWQHAGLFEQAAILGGAPAATEGNLVVAAYSSGEVFALSADDGQEIWSDAVLRPRRTLAISAINDITGAPVINGDHVIIAGNGGELVSFDRNSGSRQFNVNITSRNMPWVAGDFIYVLTDRNEVVCVLASGGRARWVSPLERLVDPEDPVSRRVFWAGPVLAGDRLILVGSTAEAVTVSPYNGEILGRVDLPGPVSVMPVVADDTLYILTDDGDLLAYR